MAMLPTRRGGQQLTLLDPSREFEDIYDRMGQLLGAAFSDMPFAQLANAPWVPFADLSETDDAYVVRAELPGIGKDQADVQLHDRELIVSGEIKDTEHGKKRRSSRRTGRFEYRTYLPGDINADQVSAKLSDGILTVTVPKSESAKPRRIEITG
ncbi:MAG TPA: Hsp20/alpha crystallin family protein [Streptosporangiaceae bacterium]|jgi:HSP20 family protein